MTLWSLAKLHDCVRSTAWFQGFNYFPDLYHPGCSITLFEVKQVFTLSREAHDVKFSSYFCLNKPQRFLLHVSHVGQTTFTLVIDWFNEMNVKIGSFSSKLCNVDRKSRRPTPLPDAFSKKNMDDHFKKYPMTSLPKSDSQQMSNFAFSFNTKALYSDCDQNNHVNQTTYVRWCSDAGAAGAIHGHFKQFENFLEQYAVKSIEMNFVGEALVNDDILINVWENENESSCLMFSIGKERKEIFNMKMTFNSM
jgi:acyl-CoA thioesterase FadM